jgi:universal stress protein E
MDSVSSVLVVIDPYASDQPCLGKAMQLANAYGARVELLLCDTPASYAERLLRNTVLDAKALNATLHEWLDSLAQPLRAGGLEISTTVVCADALHGGILEWLENRPADVVIKDTHHHSLARRTFLSNTDWHLIRDCQPALLLTKATRWRKPIGIGAAVDPVHPNDPAAFHDRAIMEAAAGLAAALQSSVQVFHAYYPAMLSLGVDAPAPLPTPVTIESFEAEQALHENAVSSLLSMLDVPEACRHVSMGVPAEFLPRMAEQCQIDILVMGALSRSRVKQHLIGSTAERLLEHLPCDLLVVKPADWAESLPR